MARADTLEELGRVVAAMTRHERIREVQSQDKSLRDELERVERGLQRQLQILHLRANTATIKSHIESDYAAIDGLLSHIEDMARDLREYCKQTMAACGTASKDLAVPRSAGSVLWITERDRTENSLLSRARRVAVQWLSRWLQPTEYKSEREGLAGILLSGFASMASDARQSIPVTVFTLAALRATGISYLFLLAGLLILAVIELFQAIATDAFTCCRRDDSGCLPKLLRFVTISLLMAGGYVVQLVLESMPDIQHRLSALDMSCPWLAKTVREVTNFRTIATVYAFWIYARGLIHNVVLVSRGRTHSDSKVSQ